MTDAQLSPPSPNITLAPFSTLAMLSYDKKEHAKQNKFSQLVNLSVHIFNLCSKFPDNKVRWQRLCEQLLPKLEIPGIENHLSIHSQMYIRAIYQAAVLQLPLD